MRWLLPLLVASLLTLVGSLSPLGAFRPPDPPSSVAGAAGRAKLAPSVAPARPLAGAARVRCERPGTLRLHRFEDRSARLECAGKVLVRVSVPG